MYCFGLFSIVLPCVCIVFDWVHAYVFVCLFVFVCIVFECIKRVNLVFLAVHRENIVVPVTGIWTHANHEAAQLQNTPLLMN